MGRSLHDDNRHSDPRHAVPRPEATSVERVSDEMAILRKSIQGVTEDQPSFAVFVERLAHRGIRVVPSVQRSGRLNGLSYEVHGMRFRGSDLGRDYTARGLAKQHRLQYDVLQDSALARGLADRRQDTAERLPRREPVARPREKEDRTPSERAAMQDIGRFRVVLISDLVRIRYGGNVGAWDRDCRALRRDGLVEVRSVAIRTHARQERGITRAVSVVVLTRKGKALMARSEPDTQGPRQTVYAGFVKPREIAHDAAIYRMFQAEAAQIAREGGRVLRVLLDYELKKKAYRPLAKARALPDDQYASRQADIARENALHVVDGKIRLPDLRIEFETAGGEVTHVDLELATEHYRGAHMQAKGQAGFKIYAEAASFPSGGSNGGGSVWDDQEIQIFSF